MGKYSPAVHFTPPTFSFIFSYYHFSGSTYWHIPCNHHITYFMMNLYYPIISCDQKFEGKIKMMSGDELGLCETCNHIYSCNLRKRYHQPVWQCEEFDDSDLIKKDLLIENDSGKMEVEDSLNANLKSKKQYLGLCYDCKNRKYCTYPRPEGGVKCCEEYE